MTHASLPRRSLRLAAVLAAALLVAMHAPAHAAGPATLLNVSHDVSREFDDVFGGWKAAQKAHFADGALYDQIVAATKR